MDYIFPIVQIVHQLVPNNKLDFKQKQVYIHFLQFNSKQCFSRFKNLKIFLHIISQYSEDTYLYQHKTIPFSGHPQ